MLVEKNVTEKSDDLINLYLRQVRELIQDVDVKDDSRSDVRSIHLIKKSSEVVVKWPLNVREPFGVDVLFIDREKSKSYVIYMTEINSRILEDVLKDLLNLTTAFFKKQYKVVVKKRFLSSAEQLQFSNPQLVYDTATKTRKFPTSYGEK